MKLKCIVCGIEYKVNTLCESLAPCPNGHTLQEELVVAEQHAKNNKQLINGSE